MHGARATDVTSLARKERQIDSMVERQIETFNAHKIANEASATREATLSQALRESERKVRELRIALETTMEGAKEAVQQQQQAQQHSVGEAVAMAAQEDSAAASPPPMTAAASPHSRRSPQASRSTRRTSRTRSRR